ncbi:regulator of G protein signaling domain-containing protein [Endogone sp. FLAS-F59071]|nr:regulator of G protein signaling domain-containing protein [Endogone sp. FLAS-F59071]|eukprot:RUS22766.1 regulator of G protein signaling domain-containing protein [Endogone sp. FLAS-F59071]
MSQSSSSMMKVTETGRPFVKDIHDLFATLMISLPFDTHRHLFKNYPNTFETEECITNLGSLKFTQSSKGPDPRDPSRIITTTVTTTFSMTRDMARSLCQQFMDARLFEIAIDPTNRFFKDRSIGQLTPKGMRVLVRFMSKNKTHTRAPQLKQILAAQPSVRILYIERSPDDDEILFEEPVMRAVLRIVMGSQPNEITTKEQGTGGTTKSNVSFKRSGLIGDGSSKEVGSASAIKQGGVEVKDRQHYYKTYQQTFHGYQVCEYLCDYTTVVCREEAEDIANYFMKHDWIEAILDKSERNRDDGLFKPTKGQLYQLTLEGRRLCGWEDSEFTESMRDDESYSDSISNSEGRTSLSGLERQDGKDGFMAKAKEKAMALFNGTRGSEADEDKSEWRTMLEPLAQGLPSASVDGDTPAHSIKRSLSPKLSSALLITTTRGGAKSGPPTTARADFLTSSNVSADSVTSPNDTESPKLVTLSRDRSRSMVDRFRNLELQSNGVNNHQLPSSSPSLYSNAGSATVTPTPTVVYDPKQSNEAKLRQILDDPQLRSLFKDHLRTNLCDENLEFWIDHQSLKRRYKSLSPALSTRAQRDLLAEALHIYNTYLAPSAPLELNIDHSLRLEMTQYMKSVAPVVAQVGGEKSVAAVVPAGSPTPGQALAAIMKLFDRTSEQICRLMATDSVPKFVKTEQYKQLIIMPVGKRDSGSAEVVEV